jgi:hypothetical protein
VLARLVVRWGGRRFSRVTSFLAYFGGLLSRPIAAGVHRRREEIERARDGEEREEEPFSFSNSLFRNAIILSSIQTHA